MQSQLFSPRAEDEIFFISMPITARTAANWRGRKDKCVDEDMAAYIQAADRLREKFACTVIIIHHCGINGDRPRGHTSSSSCEPFWPAPVTG